MARGRPWQDFSFEGDTATEVFGPVEGATRSDFRWKRLLRLPC